MATFKITGKNGSYFATYADTDVALVPQTLQSNSGSLTLQSATGALISGSDLQLAANKGISMAAGTGSADFSGGSGIGKTTTGAQTIGPGAITVSGNATMSSGTTLDSTAATTKIPVQFYVGTIQTSANVTGTNLNTLTAGSSSNADSLHTHSISPTLTGQTLWATPSVGEVGCVSGNNTLSKAKADSNSTIWAVGAYQGTSGTITTDGKMSCLFEAGLTLLAGQVVYLSAATAGRVTNVEPTTSGQYSFKLGILDDATGYSSGAGSAQPIIWQPGTPIQIG